MARALIVEDNHALAALAKAMLQREWGFSVDPASSRAETERLIAEEPQRYANLYRAKPGGRNRVVTGEPADTANPPHPPARLNREC